MLPLLDTSSTNSAGSIIDSNIVSFYTDIKCSMGDFLNNVLEDDTHEDNFYVFSIWNIWVFHWIIILALS